MALIIVVGGSGQHAAVVYEAALLSGVQVAGCATVAGGRPGQIFDCPWAGDVESIAPAQIALGTRFVIACGSNEHRQRYSEMLSSQGASFQSIVHPSAIISPSATIGAGSVLLAGSIIGPRVKLGQGVIVNHAASIDHDCEIGDYGNICPGARFGGGVRSGPGIFVGLNASIIQGLSLGQDAIVGAGAVVTRNIAAGSTVVGIPARPM